MAADPNLLKQVNEKKKPITQLNNGKQKSSREAMQAAIVARMKGKK